MHKLDGSKFRRIRRALLEWFEVNGRSFIWRERPEPYIVLISEILLKKTTAPVVNSFMPRFLGEYPTAEKIASSNERGLRDLLQPLGLSKQRSRQLIGLARALVERHGGRVPPRTSLLLDLPGVGRYTANAVRSAAFGRAVPIVDTNVARVIVRMFGIQPSRFEARKSPEIWDLARKVVGREPVRSRLLNWALLDLAAALCKPRKPKCPICPLNSYCVYGRRSQREYRRAIREQC